MAWEGLNRRKFPRANYPCLIKLARAGEKPEALLTHTENISVGGVGVIVRRQFELFTSVALEVDLMDGADPFACNGKVVWTVRRKAMETAKPLFYDTGIEFVGLRPGDRARIEIMVEWLVRGYTRGRA